MEQAWNASQGDEVLVVEFGLKNEFMLPLASGRLDPFIGIVGALAELQPGELGLFQVIFQPVQNPWAESIVNSVTHADGKPYFVNFPELAGAAENKVARPLYAVVVRILLCAGEFDRILQLARDLTGSFRVFAHPSGNELIALRNDNYPFAEHIDDVLRRQTRRTGMLLNSDELIGFVHLPSTAVRSPVFQRQTAKTKAAPNIVRHGSGLLLGENDHAGHTIEVRLSAEQRTRHTHIIGASGTGKSTLLFNLIRQDIENGEGVAVLDPHAQNRLPLYEGKMVWHFDHQYTEPRYWVDEKKGRKAVLGRSPDREQDLDYQGYRLGLRAVASNTNERTLIASVIPRNVFCGNSLLTTMGSSPDSHTLVFLAGVFDSFVLDAMLRSKATINVNMFYIYQLPVPRLTARDAGFGPIVQRAAKLICTTPEFDALAKEVGLGSHRNGVTDDSGRLQLRAELDVLVARLYGITEDEFNYILTTFPLVSDTVKQATREAYRKMAKGLIN